jgi:hypothetical protein
MNRGLSHRELGIAKPIRLFCLIKGKLDTHNVNIPGTCVGYMRSKLLDLNISPQKQNMGILLLHNTNTSWGRFREPHHESEVMSYAVMFSGTPVWTDLREVGDW